MTLKHIGGLFMGDRVIWIVYFFLCLISLVEVYSAGSSLTYKSGSFWLPLIKQGGFLIGGTIVAVVIHRVPCRIFKAIPILGYLPVIALLIISTFTGVAENGASRWITIPLTGIQFQPSELAKGMVVITTALILAQMQREDGADHRAFKFILIAAVPMCFVILLENLSTACLLFGVVMMMMFIGRVPMLQLGKLLGTLALAGALIIGVSLYVGANTEAEEAAQTEQTVQTEQRKEDGTFGWFFKLFHRAETWSSRLSKHFEEDKEAEKDPMKVDLDKDAQVSHANIAIASSNGVGKMPGNSVERDFLSQAFSDFIFAIIIEEMGLWGAAAVLFLYIVLLFRAGRIASRCERNFPPFLIMGLTLMLVSQAVLNMMVAVGLFPVTGQPLPMISRGGTSTLVTCAYFGMSLSVSRYAKQAKEPPKTQFGESMKDVIHE